MTHIIQRIRVDLRAANRSSAVAAQEEASSAFQDEIPAALGVLFDARFAPGDEPRIDRIELDLGTLPLRKFRQELLSRLVQALDQLPNPAHIPGSIGMRAAPGQVAAGAIKNLSFLETDRAGSPVEAFLHFVETGTVPWWFPFARWREDIPAALMSEGAFTLLREPLVRLILQSPARLFRLLPFPEIILALFEAEISTLGRADEVATRLPGFPELLRHRVRLVLWFLLILPGSTDRSEPVRAVLRRLLRVETSAAPGVTALLQSTLAALTRESGTGAEGDADWVAWLFSSETVTADSVKKAVLGGASEESTRRQVNIQKTERSRENESVGAEGLPTDSAGLILLHPFIPPFFNHVGWLDSRERLLPDRRWQAVQALYFLAHNRRARDEGELVLEKTLCGLDLSEAGEWAELEPEVLRETDELLRAAIAHWKALKDTSPAGLQEAFLERPGLLYRADRPRLHVEARAYDLLLNRLPWSLDRVVFPWLPFAIDIHWTAP
jgi:hypothetical protein